VPATRCTYVATARKRSAVIASAWTSMCRWDGRDPVVRLQGQWQRRCSKSFAKNTTYKPAKLKVNAILAVHLSLGTPEKRWFSALLCATSSWIAWKTNRSYLPSGCNLGFSYADLQSNIAAAAFNGRCKTLARQRRRVCKSDLC